MVEVSTHEYGHLGELHVDEGCRLCGEALVHAWLRWLGEDPGREGLKDTPRRVVDAWREFIDHDPGRLATAFEHSTVDQMVVVSGVRVWSVCEHHLLPFWCDLSMAYIPNGRVLGLSKLVRIAQAHAHRLNLQERLVANIADHIATLAEVEDVAVVGRGEHLCLTMRGAKSPHIMTTSDLRGRFRDDERARAEFLSLAK
jgi:GTP cyclohydrolase I